METNKKFAFVDLDSTLNDFIFAWVDYLNWKYGEFKCQVSDVDHWGALTDYFPEKLVWSWFHIEPYKQDLIKPLRGSAGFLKGLKELGYQPIITTHTPTHQFKEKEDWIKRYFPDVDYLLIPSQIPKPIFIESELNLTDNSRFIVVDDSPHTIEDFVNHFNHNLIEAFLFDFNGLYPYAFSTDIHNHSLVSVVFSYDDILKRLSQLG